MTSRTQRAAGCTLALLATGWTAIAFSAEPEISRQSAAAAQNDAALKQMEKDQARVVARLGVSAPMELELENGIDPIQKAVENGFIIEVTLEEVESALAAAAATTDVEDDKYALMLLHRGSYRYFSQEVRTARK